MPQRGNDYRADSEGGLQVFFLVFGILKARVGNYMGDENDEPYNRAKVIPKN